MKFGALVTLPSFMLLPLLAALGRSYLLLAFLAATPACNSSLYYRCVLSQDLLLSPFLLPCFDVARVYLCLLIFNLLPFLVHHHLRKFNVELWRLLIVHWEWKCALWQWDYIRFIRLLTMQVAL